MVNKYKYLHRNFMSTQMVSEYLPKCAEGWGSKLSCHLQIHRLEKRRKRNLALAEVRGPFPSFCF